MAIIIIRQPSDYIGQLGDTAFFHVDATGDDLTYRWQYSSGATWYYSTMTGNRTPTLRGELTEARLGYRFRCVITSGTETVYTNPVRMLTTTIEPPLMITVQPENVSGSVGSSATVSIVVGGPAPLVYQWQQSSDGVSWSSISGATGYSLTLTLAASDNGSYLRCAVTDANGRTILSEPAHVTVTSTSETINIVLQVNNSEDTHVTKDLETLQTFSGILREECSILDPIIVFEEPVTSFVGANYLTIESFGRSYFIRSITSLDTYRTEIAAHVDVLSSFADEIKANKGIVLRQENDWNLYLADDVIRCYANPIVHTMAFPSGFSGESYVLLVAGRRNAGVDVGQGGTLSGDGIDGGGAGNSDSKTTSGLLAYATAQIGRPYWFGTFGNTSSADLLSYKRAQYPDMYDTSIVGGEAFEDQYGMRVHDCVGLIKGYRWSNTPTDPPTYNASQDVNVQGLYAQCTRKRGTIDRNDLTSIPVGAVLFYANFDHCGVYAGSGNIIECRGHAYGVVTTTLATRTSFALWGVPDWMQVG